MSVVTTTVKTSHADLAVAQSSGRGLPLVLIHGNSASKDVFRRVLASELADTYRMIAVDLPGHGESSDAFDPPRTYSMPGYAEAVIEALGKLNVERLAVYGWSLGGHVALEMMPRMQGIVGVMLSGAPPVSPTPESMQSAFLPNPLTALLGKEKLTEAEIADLAGAVYGDHNSPAYMGAMRRTDGRARALMFASLFAGKISDQHAIAVESMVPVALVNGADDPFVNVDYLIKLKLPQLWERHCYALRGGGHAPFLTVPETFDSIFRRFAADMARRASAPTVRAVARRSGAAA
jgi:pimeloyl-ACP methyl ester carboxylesterase